MCGGVVIVIMLHIIMYNGGYFYVMKEVIVM